jgi:hypothetical protein
MRSKIADQQTNLGQVASEYKAAFREWAEQVGLLQSLTESQPDSWAIDEVRARADAAEAAYRETRNHLACMVAGCSARLAAAHTAIGQ